MSPESAAEKPAGDGSDSPASLLASLRGNQETILLVEDDPSVRLAMRKALSVFGYRVLEASTGADAVEVWNQNRDAVRLVLTDVVMPNGMTGMDLVQRLQQGNPALKAIYMSGYSVEAIGGDFPLEEGINFLNKPFPMTKLAETIRACLSDSST